jgi:hypothetical protein
VTGAGEGTAGDLDGVVATAAASQAAASYGAGSASRVLILAGVAVPVRAARRFAMEVCLEAGLAALAEAVALVMTELVTNAVLHTSGPERALLRVRADGVWLAVDDPSPVPPRVQSHSLRSGTGRGLQMTRAFTRTWGYQARADGGKQVWALVTPESVGTAEDELTGGLLAEVE